jgi:hypothetical protein
MISDITGNPTSVDESEVAELLRCIEEQLVIAWVEGSRSFIEQMLADDWSVIDLRERILKRLKCWKKRLF